MKVNVIGTSGSGKSTFLKALACALNIPYVEMDRLHWKPNWTESSDDEFSSHLSRRCVAALGCWMATTLEPLTSSGAELIE
jgi:adenylate kinase family enzyme